MVGYDWLLVVGSVVAVLLYCFVCFDICWFLLCDCFLGFVLIVACVWLFLGLAA